MNKCLVTTLKAQTNNEALSKYNVLTVKIKAASQENMFAQVIALGASSSGEVLINSNNIGLYKSGISGELLPYPVKIPANTSFNRYFENKDGVIEIIGKYNLNSLVFEDMATLKARELYGLPDGCINKQLIVRNFEEDEFDATKIVAKINKATVTTLYVPFNKTIINKVPASVIGSFVKITNANEAFNILFDKPTLNDYVECVNLTIIRMSTIKGGNLSSLRKMIKLSEITFWNTNQNSGDIMDFITPWIQAGRTSGKLKTQYLKSQNSITLNGSPLTFPEGSYAADGTCYINWTSNGTVTFTAS